MNTHTNPPAPSTPHPLTTGAAQVTRGEAIHPDRKEGLPAPFDPLEQWVQCHLSPLALSAYRAVRDCRVIRTRFDHPGFIELYEIDYADYQPVGGDENAADWRLTW